MRNPHLLPGPAVAFARVGRRRMQLTRATARADIRWNPDTDTSRALVWLGVAGDGHHKGYTVPLWLDFN